MLDQAAVTRLIEQQIATIVDQQVMAVFASDAWLKPIEQKIVQFTQDRILGKFSNSSALPELMEAVKNSVEQLFATGQVPGIEQYVDETDIKQAIDSAVEDLVGNAIATMSQDAAWLQKVETLINQTVVQRTMLKLNATDIPAVIQQQVYDNMDTIHLRLLNEFNSAGIKDQATQTQLTIMDDTTVVENTLTTNHLDVIGSATIKNLAVKGSINTDNPAWDELANTISQKTLDKVTTKWHESLVAQVVDNIKADGIDFDRVTVDGLKLIDGHKLSPGITESNIQNLGILNRLRVKGEATIYDTFSVVNKRVGINTQEPEMALSVWDEEVSVIAGKLKNKTAYVGTSRDQSLTMGVNRQPYIEIDNSGLTAIKKLQVGVHKISHADEVPGYAGTKGDIVFNASPSVNSDVFAWVCLGAYKWKVLRAVE